VTIIERKSKFMVMKKIENKTAELVAAATIELLRPYKDLVLTITADRGREFAHHEKVAKALDCDKRSNTKGGHYFAHPYSSWGCGLNEHTNGLIRQFFPKGSIFEEITERMVKRVKGLLNRRPRKSANTRRQQRRFLENHSKWMLNFKVEWAFVRSEINHELYRRLH